MELYEKKIYKTKIAHVLSTSAGKSDVFESLVSLYVGAEKFLENVKFKMNFFCQKCYRKNMIYCKSCEEDTVNLIGENTILKSFKEVSI